jgi:hypothetical protein
MKRHEITVEHLFRLSDRGVDPGRELDLVQNIQRYVPDPHLFAMAYANYAQTVRELCSGEPEPVSQFLQRWPSRKAII